MRYATALAALTLALATPADSATTTNQGHSFEAYVSTASCRRGSFPENRESGRTVLRIREGEEYSIVVHNPLPVRVGVAVTVDGLNTIDGERTKPGQAAKWIVEPYSSTTVRGWQTGANALRKFVFTRPEKSYADWKEKRDGVNYTGNLGVIGIAWFWSSSELADALNPPRTFSYSGDTDGRAPGGASCRKEKAEAEAPAPPGVRSRAGTGMGRKENNAVHRVEFDFDTGMYSSAQVLKIYYEFRCERRLPQPFDDDPMGFAPDMHR